MINYYLLTKPGILLGNLITFAAGFLLASRGDFDLGLFLAALFGLGLTMASACVLNNYIDRKTDAKMKRTKKRPLVTGLISGRNALLFAAIMGICGSLILIIFTNILSFAAAAIGFFVYVVLYSSWKCRTIYGTAIGSIAGAIPPVVGYFAAGNRLDAGALILFAMMVLWQMPHFYAIAMYHYDDYVAAGIPALPIIKGPARAKMHMTAYICGFVIVALMLTYFNYTGYAYMVMVLMMGSIWLGICLKGFLVKDNRVWGRDMFRFSLILIVSLSIIIPLNIV